MHSRCTGLLVLLGLICFSNAATSGTSLIIMDGTYYYIEASAPKNWFSALAACSDMGYQLISFGTPEKLKQVGRFLIASGQPSLFWTSGNDFFSLGDHTFYPAGESVNATIWGAKQPKTTGVEHCDAIFKGKTNYTLQVDNCNLARNYICELKSS